MFSPYRTLKEEAWIANQKLVREGLVFHTFGNASALDRQKGLLAIKPSGVPYDRMKPKDMVVTDLECRIVEGKLRPSLDLKTHAYLFRKWDGIQGVAHTHSAYATAWAQAMRSIPVLGTTHADALCVPVPCTPVMNDEMVQGDYEEATGRLIVETLSELSPLKVQMVLVAGHGPFTWGENAEAAADHSSVLEMLARMAWLTVVLEPGTPDLKKALLEKHYRRKHGGNAYYGQNV